MAKKASNEIVRCMKVAVRFLVKARDMYVEAMLGCSSVGGSIVVGCSNPQFSTLHYNFSVNSLKSCNDQDVRAVQELIQRQQCKHWTRLLCLGARAWGGWGGSMKRGLVSLEMMMMSRS